MGMWVEDDPTPSDSQFRNMDTQKAPSTTPRSQQRTARWLIGAVLLALSVQLADHLSSVHNQLERLESSRRNQAALFRQGLFGVRDEISSIRTEVVSNLDEVEEANSLAGRLRQAETLLGDIGRAVEAQTSNLTELAEAQAVLPSSTEILSQDEQLRELNELVSSTHKAAFDTMERVQRIDQEFVTRDLSTMWRELVGPVVQLAGESSVGSGVLLESVWDASRATYSTYLITAWHVVRDIQGDLSNTAMPVPVNIYHEDGSIQPEEAKLLVFNVELDAALLEIHTPDLLPNSASLATRKQLANTRIFDRIYAVGCPLGNDPIPTPGEVATCRHRVEGELYWMINAPTYIGNSGGGIFDAETHELLGIFSKIYTHGSLRPTIVPHMGLVTPLSEIYGWLDEEGYEKLVPTARNASTKR